MSDHTLFAQIKDEAARPDPYPLFARLRECPVSRQADGTYVAASHAAIASLLHDPRVSSETLPPADRPKTGNPLKDHGVLAPLDERVAQARAQQDRIAGPEVRREQRRSSDDQQDREAEEHARMA